MKILDAARFVVGSAAVYLLVSACGSAGAMKVFRDGGADKDARAGEPAVAVESCSQTLQTGIVSMRYAEHAYAGKTANELAGVVALGHYAADDPHGLPEHVVALRTFVADGKVAVDCDDTGTSRPRVDSVQFFLWE